MITKFRVILPEDTMEQAYSLDRVREVEWPAKPGYEMINALVMPFLGGKGHLLDHASVLEDFNFGENFVPLDMFVDELGLQNRLPRNEVATTAYRRANQMGLTGAPKAENVEQLNFIVGPAVLFSRRVWF